MPECPTDELFRGRNYAVFGRVIYSKRFSEPVCEGLKPRFYNDASIMCMWRILNAIFLAASVESANF